MILVSENAVGGEVNRNSGVCDAGTGSGVPDPFPERRPRFKRHLANRGRNGESLKGLLGAVPRIKSMPTIARGNGVDQGALLPGDRPSDRDVVEDLDLDQSPHLDEVPGEADVGFGGGGIAAGMVVDEDHR